ncbi:Nuclear control of ATPase protein 2 [Ophidiomyces ophidiicola]|uniref:Nuclear control of ATPase protein 2 n=1 Tax=Ophidiomyces ophidiicola TaxID=1387563 RepID=A0ACB8URC2_9EURO|nr:Nuclear control of ATPase protein 2 [Ophidiomyces ophidiicola]KAI1945720.1 Nuclear control of ATPase protein 2 [Ophidiomyces ophidiicola]KAI2006647.1 Nuclear control of ATPase protein 2 [Ophidiomyces ophidiicola]KAI2018358.1 Nuclear control of ATPase protein 2 [Ophidiomyces ophidiicola]KAI2044728.1 Nuclear control of ATPase protein 2 [Ophidiomyces ophidiicola]KAI2059638.1 Nuclear control of ATPase protein 2 [Ophidiomyces ophidiicola]
MSLVEDHVRRLDLYLDKLQLRALEPALLPGTAHHDSITLADHLAAPTVAAIAGIARAFSASSPSGPLLKRAKLIDLLSKVHDLRPSLEKSVATLDGNYSSDLVWMVAAKATVQTFAIVINSLLDEAAPLSDGIWYWDGILGSYLSCGLHAFQTSPIRLGQHIKDIYNKARQIQPQWRSELDGSTISARWSAFYRLVRESVRQQSIAHAKQIMLSPFQLCRSEARKNRRSLKKLREMNACAVGLLMEEALLFDFDEEDTNTNTATNSPDDWQDTVFRTTLLMRAVVKNVNDLSNDFTGFEENVFATVDAVESPFVDGPQKPSLENAFDVIQQLKTILEEHLPRQQLLSKRLFHECGRPSRFVRYWLPVSAILFSSSTILNILTNRRSEVVGWLQESGTTLKDFWINWVVEPINQLIGTIRHDEKSQVALMSKGSLQSDLASLERMVVDYAVRHPENGSSQTFSPAELEQIRLAVKEGDLTLVLKAYERDLQTPLMGAVRGDLITTLLIQIQKTKVDVEVAMSGIDSLLKSQQLVFAFIGLTPGILVSYSVISWFAGAFGSRRGIRQGKRRAEARRSLRSVNRIVSSSVPTPTGVLTYKDHGLLICEAEILRSRAYEVLPGHIYHEFHEDLNDLLNVRSGVVQQLRVLDRIRWAYAQWIR